MDDFERRLATGLHELVDGETPSPELRERVGAGAPSNRSGWITWRVGAAAAVVVVALVGAALVMSDRGGSPDLDVAAVSGDTTSVVPTTRVTTTTSTTVVDAEDPETAPAATVDDPEVLSETASPPTTVPTTTAPSCQNSTDPACGPFHWSPEPANQPATLVASVDGPVRAGELFQVDLTMTDPDGTVDFDCVLVEHDGPGIEVGSCGPATPLECPDRYGPWTPPPPQGSEGTSHATIEISEPGTYTVQARVSSFAACANVDPYRSDASTSIEVEVLPAE